MEPAVALVVLGGLLLAAAIVVGLYLSRQRALSRRVGSFRCLLRPGVGQDGPWVAGRAQYATGRLLWWRTLSLSPWPARTWFRAELTLGERTPLDEVDDAGRPLLLVRCTHRTESFELIMSVGARTGLVSWLESAPRPANRTP